MTATLPLVLPGFRISRVTQTKHHLQVHAHATTPSACCPDCGLDSSRVHSYYTRRPNDLPSSQWRLQLHLLVRRFRCTNTTCAKKTFAERLTALIKPFARRTERLTHALRQIGLALGGQAGARLARTLRMPASADTLLRIVAKTPRPETGQPRVVGVDEWAWHRGHRYGTILVDLEARQVLDLLPDRSAHSLAQWLKVHPSIAILTRDRSVEYAQGMRLGAPEAVHVADRWHLLKNLHDVLKRFFEGQHTRIKSLLEHQQVTTWPQPFVRCPAEQQRRRHKRQRRQARYNRVLRLYQAGMPIRHIAQAVGVVTP